ncbi:MAG: putative aliphatic sulfonates-binding protein [Verrucomicrobiota bacterium]
MKAGTHIARFGLSQAAIFGIAGACLLSAFQGVAAEKAVLRVGHFPNLTHAQGVVAHGLSRSGKGWFESRLGAGVEVQWFVYNAGPSAMEAIFTKSLDLSYVGPSPTINAFVKSDGKEIRIVAGACSGGAALVVQPDGRIRTDADFKKRKIATPQLGNTQDVAARAWLISKGYKVTMTGGDVMVIPTANPDQLTLFQRGDLDAVWTVEPWVTRLEREAGAKVYFEESALWKETGGRYVTTHLVGRVKFMQKQRDLLAKFIAAHVELTQWINDHPAEAQRILNDELKAEVGQSLASETLTNAWRQLEFTTDPVRRSLLRSAEDARRVGFLRSTVDLSSIYDLDLLNTALRERKLPEAK